MDRAKIENVLMDMGIPAGIKGFSLIADAVEYIDEHGENISVTKELYPDIAKARKTTPSRAERSIRHAFGIARSEKGNYAVAEKYIGFMDCKNFNSIVMLHKKIKQDSAGINAEPKKNEKIAEPTEKITELKIREIIRQELRIALNELVGGATS